MDKRRAAAALMIRVLAGTPALLTCAACVQFRYQNTAPFIEHGVRASGNPVALLMFKAGILVPARDILTLDPIWRALFGDEAWDLIDGNVPDGSFYTNRDAAELTPERAAIGACTMPPPQSPFRIKKLKSGSGGILGFIGTDAEDRTFLFKLDHPNYPELGSTASVVGSRVLWSLGYNVPPVFLVEISGTGDERFDGRRAVAVLFLEDTIGHFHFDWFRHRRELRALRLASAWINDSDRIGSNTLVVDRDGRATYYLIDFNSCLGSWQGRPKEPWRGYRHAWCPLPAPPKPPPPLISPALGRLAAEFDPLRWLPQAPNNAFNHMTAADAAWMIARIELLERPHLRAIVAEAHLRDPDDADTLVELLLRRREAIIGLAR